MMICGSVSKNAGVVSTRTEPGLKGYGDLSQLRSDWAGIVDQESLPGRPGLAVSVWQLSDMLRRQPGGGRHQETDQFSGVLDGSDPILVDPVRSEIRLP